MSRFNAGTLAWMAAAAFAVAVPVAAAHAQGTSSQRLSLADRVARLEQQAQSDQGGLGLVNQVQTLQSQIQTMQGQIERLQHDLQQLQQQNKDQYIDLDSRLGRLEGRPSDAAGPASADSTQGPAQLPDVPLGSGAPVASVPSAPAAAPPASVLDAGAGDLGAAPADAQSDYDQAFSSLRSGNFASASRGFSAFIRQHPRSDLMPNAYYWLGESYYGTQNYPVALQTFNALLQNYPDSTKAKDALLKVGYCQFELQQWSASQATLQRVIQKYPGSSDARLAAGRLRALALQTGQ